MIAKTNAERQRELRQNRLKQGLKEVRNLWCHPDDIQSIQEHARHLASKRKKGANQLTKEKE